MKFSRLFLFLTFSFTAFPSNSAPDTQKYKCDIRISSSETETIIKKGAAMVTDKNNSFLVVMPNGKKLYSPELTDTNDGLNKQKGSTGNVIFIRRLDFNDKFIIEDYDTGFFYKMRDCETVK